MKNMAGVRDRGSLLQECCWAGAVLSKSAGLGLDSTTSLLRLSPQLLLESLSSAAAQLFAGGAWPRTCTLGAGAQARPAQPAT